ncbi:hypothetical protein [Paraburkholderia kururiensis]|uniref:hypothetical protein n=1 Tax=Paraburkholderia kururiensis TaxID=984307 RepID=UPI0039A4AACB
MIRLIKSDGVSTSGHAVDPGILGEFVVASARRSVKAVRENNIEGYVLFDGEPARYEFTPDADFVHPKAIQ